MRVSIIALITGGTLLGVAFASFAFKSMFLGTPPLIFEGIGAGLVMYHVGYEKGKVLFWVMLGAVISAALFDPLLWAATGLEVEHAGTISFLVNGVLGLIIIIAYYIGSVARKKLIA